MKVSMTIGDRQPRLYIVHEVRTDRRQDRFTHQTGTVERGCDHGQDQHQAREAHQYQPYQAFSSRHVWLPASRGALLSPLHSTREAREPDEIAMQGRMYSKMIPIILRALRGAGSGDSPGRLRHVLLNCHHEPVEVIRLPDDIGHAHADITQQRTAGGRYQHHGDAGQILTHR